MSNDNVNPNAPVNPVSDLTIADIMGVQAGVDRAEDLLVKFKESKSRAYRTMRKEQESKGLILSKGAYTPDRLRKLASRGISDADRARIAHIFE